MNDEPDFLGTNPEHVTEATTSIAESPTSPPDLANQPAGHTPEPNPKPEGKTAGDATSSDRIASLDLDAWPVAHLSRLIATARDIQVMSTRAARQRLTRRRSAS